VYREIKRNSLGARASEIGRGSYRKIDGEKSLDDDTRISLSSGTGFRLRGIVCELGLRALDKIKWKPTDGSLLCLNSFPPELH
jgi:hypothetical protein